MPSPSAITSLVVICLAGTAAATEPGAAGEDRKGTLSFSYENDVFSNTDRHYTNGVRLSYLGAAGDLPAWLDAAVNAVPLFPEQGTRRIGLALGQSMYTPDDISRATPDPTDRPYAGWLYFSLGVVSELDNNLDILELDLGMIGPASLADRTQKFAHTLTGSQQPQGWDSQLRNEPGLLITYQRKWRALVEAAPFGLGADLTPYAGATLGNVLTQAVAGTTIRIGFDLPADYGPPRVRPSLTGSDYFVPRQSVGWYLFAGVEGRAVLRNIFFDGNSFRDGSRVEKRTFVGDVTFGVAVTLGDVRFAYTHVFATNEFHGQHGADSFGSFSLSTRF